MPSIFILPLPDSFASVLFCLMAIVRRCCTRFALGCFIALTFGVAAPSAICAAPLPQPQPSFTMVAQGAWNLDWNGVAERTYFIQTSLDLVTWFYQPVMAFGDGTWTTPLGSSSPKYFVRLRFVDAKGIANLAEAKAADYDGDGVSNRFEVEVEMSDPLNAASHGGDSDGDGLPDGWEREYFGNLTHNGAVDSDGDGLTDAQEWQLGSNPLLADTDGDGAADGILRQELQYDRIGRLDSADGGAAGAQAFITDAVGNVELGDGMAAGIP